MELSAAESFARAQALLPPSGATVLAMVSGGADSVALLDLACASARWRVAVFHLDHALRAESAEDAAFVAELARARGLDLICERADIARIARCARIGVEDAARRERYRRAARAAKRLGAQAILTAHHRDDQVETVLMHLLRGSGACGRAGMPASRALGEVSLVRPLLQSSRAGLREHLRARGLAWREDASNGDGRFRRNHLRARALPRLESAEPGFAQALLALAGPPGAVEDGEAADALRALRAHGLAASRAQVRALRALRQRPEGAALTLGRWRIERVGGQLAWRDRRALAALAGSVAAVEIAGPTSVRRGGELLTLTRASAPADPRAGPGRAWIDAAALSWPLSWRASTSAERWTPLGAPGSQRVRKSLADRKVPARERPRVGVLADQIGVVWVPGLGIASRVRITPATRQAIHGAVEPVPLQGGGGSTPGG